jgi:chaperonin GroEL
MGISALIILEKIINEPFDIGYDAAEDKFGNMYELGIIDPCKVSRSAVQNATSIAGMILTTECIVVDTLSS